MEPSVRPYNTNGPGRRARRASGAGTRSEVAPAAAPAHRPRAVVLVAEKSASAEVEASVAEVEVEGATSAPAEAAADVLTLAEAGAQREVEHEAEAGSVVGLADFEDIFTRFQTPITNFVYRLVGNREQAYDLSQDVFVKAYRALASGTTIQAAALSSWLYRIASNTATDALRRKRLINWLPLSLFNEDRGVGAGMPGAETPSQQRLADREVVERVLRRLPEKYAACLLLYEHEGFSCAEIAEVLKVTPSAVKMRLMRARERFIALYKQETQGQDD